MILAFTIKKATGENPNTAEVTLKFNLFEPIEDMDIRVRELNF